MRTFSLVLIVPVLGIVTSLLHEPSTAESYDEPDAYQIYSLLLPQEESYGFAKGTLIIQAETESSAPLAEECLNPETAKQFKDAISDYEHSRTRHWLLQRRLKIEKPYEIVSSEKMARLEASDQPRPKSGGHIFMSPVGFNKSKTLAIVYTGSICGGLCGSSKFHLLMKVNGQWKEVHGVSCVTVS